MIELDWSRSREALEGFGGASVRLTVPKTGLPFFDTLRLYGAIDLFLGFREDVMIHDLGAVWEVTGRSRRNLLAGRAEAAFHQVWKKRTPAAAPYVAALRNCLQSARAVQADCVVPATKGLTGLDSALQSGVRDTAAAKYETLQTGQTSESTCCVLKLRLADGILAFAGKRRVEGIGSITFLPIFEGRIDLSKVVNPLRAWVGLPSVLCSQALALLALKSALFTDGYQDRLRGVVFNTALAGQRSDNYSGLLDIISTAIGRLDSADFVSHLYVTVRRLVALAWKRTGRDYVATELAPHALALARWVMQAGPRELAAMITSQERLHRDRVGHVFAKAEYVREVFDMSYEDWKGDHEAVRTFAKAVASAIYHARMATERIKTAEDQQKAWYDEVTMLRSAPSPRSFVGHAMILVEQGHREHALVGTAHRQEAFDPQALLQSLGSGTSFEIFRDLFRMYLVQESTYQARKQRATGPEEAVVMGPEGLSEEEVDE